MPEALGQQPVEANLPKAGSPEGKAKTPIKDLVGSLKNGVDKGLQFLAEKARARRLSKDPGLAVEAAVSGDSAGIKAIDKLLQSTDAQVADSAKYLALSGVVTLERRIANPNDSLFKAKNEQSLQNLRMAFPDLMQEHAETRAQMQDSALGEKLLLDAKNLADSESATIPKATEIRTVAEAKQISATLRPAREKYSYLRSLADKADVSVAQAPSGEVSVEPSPQVVSVEATPVAQKETEKISPEVRSAVVDSLGIDFLNTLDHVEEGLDQPPTLQDFASYLRALKLINDADTSLSPTQRAAKDKALRNLVYQMNIGGTAANENEGGFVYANHTPGEIVKYMRENPGNVHLYSDLSGESGSDEIGKLNELIAEGGLLAQAATDKIEIRKVILQAKDLVKEGVSNEVQVQVKIKLTVQESAQLRNLRNLRDQGLLTQEQVANLGGIARDVFLGMDQKYELSDEEEERVPALV